MSVRAYAPAWGDPLTNAGAKKVIARLRARVGQPPPRKKPDHTQGTFRTCVGQPAPVNRIGNVNPNELWHSE